MNRADAINSLAVIGDVADPAAWSGTPYHFWSAARSAGWETAPWKVDLAGHRWSRRRWNLGRLLRGSQLGGYQYSEAFLDQAERAVSAPLWQGRVLSFSQHFPRAASVVRHGGRPLHYIDATLASFCGPDGLEARLPTTIRAEARRIERENYAASERVVTMARWAADSAAEQCGVPRSKLATILPGANLALPSDYDFPVSPGRPGYDRPLVLGFIGKDWQRKGLPFVLAVQDELERMGIKVVVRCAGFAPAELKHRRGVEFVGFINKARDPGRFVAFLAGCDVGCLFSSHEPLGISTLEFLRAGVPVAGFAVEGLCDTLPPNAGFRFAPGTKPVEAAEVFRAAFADDMHVAGLRAAAREWSPLVTWERCVREWQELLVTGQIADPVQPWRRRRAA